MEKEIRKHLVDSTNIEWIAYDEKSKTLTVQFHSGGLYEYYKVPKKVFEEFLEAGSKGRYHALKIKYNYDYKKIN